MPRHIGIVACSAEGAALCYRTICVEGARLVGAHAHPEISMHTHSLDKYLKFLECDDWQGVGDLMLSSATKLFRAAAEFLICPDNTIHSALPYVRSKSPLPWLRIAEVVVAEAVARGYRCLGITGTRWLLDSEVYPEQITRRGLRYLRPDAAERDEFHRIIMDELVYGEFKPEATAYFQRSIQRMKAAGCENPAEHAGRDRSRPFALHPPWPRELRNDDAEPAAVPRLACRFGSRSRYVRIPPRGGLRRTHCAIASE